MAETSIMQRVSHELTRSGPMLQQMLPAEITPERLKAFSLVAMRANPKLLQCDVHSLLGAVYECAKAGLEPDGVQAAVIPRKGKATFQVMFRGAMIIARRSGDVRQIWTGEVRQNDTFEYEEGAAPALRHKPASGNRGEIIYAYACARFSDGFVQFYVVDQADIARARRTSYDYADSPWNTHEGQMWRKTAVKLLCKSLPLESRSQRALVLDDVVEADKDQGLDQVWQVTADSPDAADGKRVSDSDIVDVPAGDDPCPACGKVDGHVEGCPEALG